MTDLPPPPPPPSGFTPPGGGLPGAQAPRFAPAGAHSGGPAAHALPAAPWGRRAGALLLDLLFQFLAVVAVAVLVAVVTGGDSFTYETEDTDGEFVIETLPYWAAWAGGVGVLLLFTYPWVTMGLMKGASPGRRAVGIRVVNVDGSRPGFGKAFLREGVTKGALSLFSLPLLLSYLWPLWDPHQRALHDLVCSTRAVTDTGAEPTDAFGSTTFGGGAYVPPMASTPNPVAQSQKPDDGLAGRIGLGG